MKTKTCIIIIVIINLIIPRPIYATTMDDSIGKENLQDIHGSISENLTNSLLESGEAGLNPATLGEKEGTYETKNQIMKVFPSNSIGGTIGSILAMAITFIPAMLNSIMTGIVTGEVPVKHANSSVKRLTIQDIIFNKYALFDIDFFDNASTNTNQQKLSSKVSSKFQENISKAASTWYVALQKLAIILSLLILIYIGIRMVMSTVGEEQAKYKQMFFAWVQGFILIFVLHYIVIMAIWASNAIMKIIPTPTTNLEDYIIQGNTETEEEGLEEQIFEQAKGWNLVWYCIMYFMFTYYQVKFALKYLYRIITVYFLLIIGPIISVTFSIDKVKDNKAQSFQIWIKELLVNIFIQPIHAILYFIFIVSAGEIAKVAPLLAIFFFAGLSRGEKIIKDIFDIRGLKTIKSIGNHEHMEKILKKYKE